MVESEYNLSVLEDATIFASPLKNSSDYETIFALIKEEVDINNTEDETESQKGEKRPHLGTKIMNLDSSDHQTIFKANKRNSLRLKSPRRLLKTSYTDGWRNSEKAYAVHNSRGTRSLGIAKPRRSIQLNHRRNRSSVSQSSESLYQSNFRDNNNSVETANTILPNGDISEIEVEEKILIEEEIPKAIEDKELNECGLAKDSILPTNDFASPPQTQDSDFVESSQSTVTSNLRKKLLSRHSDVENRLLAVTTENENNERNGLPESEDDGHNFSLSYSPESKSQTSSDTRETSITPTKSLKRKANAVCPIVGSTPKQQRLEAAKDINTKSPRARQSKIVFASPLKGLTQELDNCINDSDYEQLSEDLHTDMLDGTSFTFETIELLNQYDGTNQLTNNRILSKIFSSPSAIIKNEMNDNSNNTGDEDQPIEDPLYIEESEANSYAPESDREKSSGPLTNEIKRKTIQTTNLLKPEQRSTLKTVLEKAGSVKSSTLTNNNRVKKTTRETPKKLSEVRKKNEAKKRSTRETPVEKEKNISSILEGEQNEQELINNPTELGMMENIEGEKKRRYSSRLKMKQPEKNDSLELEDDEDLAMEAANIAQNIEDAEKKAALSDEILNKLENLEIQLRHEVLPQHKIENRAGSKALSYKQQKKFVQFAPLSKQTYSPAEDEIIKKNWKAFCEDHDWDPREYKPFLSFKHGNKLIMSSLEERRKFVQFLADGLPNRPLCSVYSRFRILYGKPQTAGSRYTKEEDMKILAYMLHKPATNPDTKCSELAKVLDRTRESIWKRYKKLLLKYIQKDEKKVLTKVKWNLALVEEFITILLDISVCENLMELKDAFIPKVVWLKMEQKMGIDHRVMKRFWDHQLHMQLFAADPLYLNQIRVELIEYMYMKKLWHPAEIKWQEIVGYFDGMTTSFLRNVFNDLVTKASRKINTKNFKNILKWLYTKKIDELIGESKDKCLPRIHYKDKKAEILNEDIEKIRSNLESSKND